jgi:hypothetical protein
MTIPTINGWKLKILQHISRLFKRLKICIHCVKIIQPVTMRRQKYLILERNRARPIPIYITERYCLGIDEWGRVIPRVTIITIIR